MRIPASALYISFLLTCTQACSQVGDHMRTRDAPDLTRAAAPGCDSAQKADCPAGEARPAVKPAVPPVPTSPIKERCDQLPTQVERDTCTNRKESTG